MRPLHLYLSLELENRSKYAKKSRLPLGHRGHCPTRVVQVPEGTENKKAADMSATFLFYVFSLKPLIHRISGPILPS